MSTPSLANLRDVRERCAALETQMTWATAAALPTCALSSNVLTASSNGALTGESAADGVTVAVGDKVLVKNQVAGLQNGVYVVTAVGGASAKWSMARLFPFNKNGRLKGGQIFSVVKGTANGGKAFMITNTTAIDINTTAITVGTATAAAPGAGSITRVMLDADVVDGTKLADDAVDSEHIADGAVDPVHAAVGATMAGTGAVGVYAIPWVVRAPFAAGTPGSPDDVMVTDTLPGKCRLVDLQILLSTGINSSTITLRSAAAGGGTALSDAIATEIANQGSQRWNHTTTPELAASSALYLRRSDQGIEGTAVLTLIPVA